MPFMCCSLFLPPCASGKQLGLGCVAQMGDPIEANQILHMIKGLFMKRWLELAPHHGNYLEISSSIPE